MLLAFYRNQVATKLERTMTACEPLLWIASRRICSSLCFVFFRIPIRSGRRFTRTHSRSVHVVCVLYRIVNKQRATSWPVNLFVEIFAPFILLYAKNVNWKNQQHSNSVVAKSRWELCTMRTCAASGEFVKENKSLKGESLTIVDWRLIWEMRHRIAEETVVDVES